MSGRLHILKAALGGELSGRTLLCPTIGHSSKDRGTAYTESPTAPNGLLVEVYNGLGRADDLAAKDRALFILGEEPDFARRRRERDDPIASMQNRAARRAAHEQERANAATRQLRALRIWRAGQDPRGTLVDAYLRSRGLDLSDEVAGSVLRFAPRCPIGQGQTAPAMIALMRDALTGEPKALHRTILTSDGRKVGRKMLGPVSGTAVMLDAEDGITTGLAVGEGIETCLAARQLGIRPVWAMTSTAGIISLPVLPGIETLTLFVENDANGASERACRGAGIRWHRAGRAVDMVRPRIGKDLNDQLLGGAAA